ncbi:hypothetical protein [Sporichthya sp.]|uniref:hypothetical protein n=1 Tax=Sporichthya sp. TaxID=65475 RepID=UPI00182459BE|nr:hypothetical protein [Sporichthya sp.]MBA3744781.1 hypothetical protein [Sporichthya sp.]
MGKRWSAATGALVVAAGSAIIWAPAAQAAEDTIVRTCKGNVDGEKVKLRATLHLRSQSDNDVTALDLRATDNNESGGFRNADVNLRKVLFRVKDEDGKLVAKSESPSSPFGVDLGSAGEEVGRVHTEAKFRSGDRTGVVICTFTFKDSDNEGGSGNG